MREDASERIFYLDTSIWMDWFEDREWFAGEPLGYYAQKLLSTLKSKDCRIAISDILMGELSNNYSDPELNGLFFQFSAILIKSVSSEIQRDEAARIARSRGIPYGDALHAVICRDRGYILVTRDNDFRKLRDVCESFRPEELV